MRTIRAIPLWPLIAGVRWRVILRRTLLFAALLSCPLYADTPITLPPLVVEQWTQTAQKNFWGKAVGADLKPIQLPLGRDPMEPLISGDEASRVVHAGVPAGVAVWCEMPWKRYYAKFMNEERAKAKWSDTQIAFIGVLFSYSQYAIADMMSKGTCTDAHRAGVVRDMGQ